MNVNAANFFRKIEEKTEIHQERTEFEALGIEKRKKMKRKDNRAGRVKWVGFFKILEYKIGDGSFDSELDMCPLKLRTNLCQSIMGEVYFNQKYDENIFEPK